MTASRSGLGMPLLFVLPSAASANIVSSSCSNRSAGRTSQRKRTTSSPAFQKRWGVPAGIVTVSPGSATISSPPTLRPSRPETTSNCSFCLGWTWAAATKPPGWTNVSMTTASPFVSREVWWKTIRSPVTGFSITSPACIMSFSLPVDCRPAARSIKRDARREWPGDRRPQAGSSFAPASDFRALEPRPRGGALVHPGVD